MILSTGMALASCQSPTALNASRDYSKRYTEKTDKIFQVISDDYYNSCLREAGFASLDSAGPDPLGNVKKEIDNCKKGLLSNKQSIDKIHELLRVYISSLGLLAGADFTIGPELDRIKKGLESTPLLTDEATIETASIAFAVASRLSDFILQGYQLNQLRHIVSESDEDIRLIAGFLAETFSTKYARQLRREEQEINRTFRRPIDNVLIPNQREIGSNAVEEYILINTQQAWVASSSEINSRLSLNASYSQLLKDLSCDHSRLKDMLREDLSSKAASQNRFCNPVVEAGSSGGPTSEVRELRPEEVPSLINSYMMRIDTLERIASSLGQG